MPYGKWPKDFPCGTVVKNLSCRAGDMGLILGQGTRIPHPTEQLSLDTTGALTCTTKV